MSTSTISNTIRDNATPVAGVAVTAILRRGFFRVDDHTEIGGYHTTTTDGSGQWALNLERQANIDPAGSWWEINEQLTVGQGGPRQWAISVGASNATLQASLITPPPANAAAYLTQAAADARYLETGTVIGFTDTAERYVTTTGDDDRDGLSWGSAKATVAAALAALPGDGGVVKGGLGNIDGDYTIPANTTVVGVSRAGTNFRGKVTTAAGIRSAALKMCTVTSTVDAFELAADFGGINVEDVDLVCGGTSFKGFDASAGNGIDLNLKRVRVRGACGVAFDLDCAQPVNTANLESCYSDEADIGFSTHNSGGTMVGCAADNASNTAFLLGGHWVLDQPTAEGGAGIGFHVAGVGEITLCSPSTVNQMVPYRIAAEASVTLINPASSSTPGTYSVVLTSGATGYNVVIGGKRLDLPYSIDPAAYLSRVGADLASTGTLSVAGVAIDATTPLVALYVASVLRAFLNYDNATSTARLDSDGDVVVAPNNTIAERWLTNGQRQSIAANETAGGGAALLGANSPAVTNAAPYTWLKVTTSDGSQGYIPVWK